MNNIIFDKFVKYIIKQYDVTENEAISLIASNEEYLLTISIALSFLASVLGF